MLLAAANALIRLACPLVAPQELLDELVRFPAHRPPPLSDDKLRRSSGDLGREMNDLGREMNDLGREMELLLYGRVGGLEEKLLRMRAQEKVREHTDVT